jgi:O-antigen/teichoic acid export membrane protein
MIVMTRLLDKEQYGIWNYAYNIYSLILLFDGLGIASGVLQYCSKERNERKRFLIFKFGKSFGEYVNLFISFFTLILALLAPLKFSSARLYLLAISFLPTIRILYTISIQYIRASKRAKTYGYVTFFYAVSYFVFVLLTVPIFDVWGIIVSEYVVILFSLLFLKNQIHEVSNFYEEERLESGFKKEILRFSVVANLTNIMSHLLYLLDTFLVGQIIGKAEILASYKVATLIPYNLNFIPMALMTFFYPYFAEKSYDKFWIRKNTGKLIKMLFFINAIIVIFIILFSDYVIYFLFGDKYSDSSMILKVLMIGYFFAGTLRIPLGNIIASLGKVKINLVNSIITGLSNIVLDIILILKYGAIGAAIATVLVFVLSSVINVYAFLKLTK